MNSDNAGLIAIGVVGLFVILIGLAAWATMLGYPLLVEIVFVDGQELVNPTISYIDSLVFMIAVFMLNGGPVAVLAKTAS